MYIQTGVLSRVHYCSDS